MLVFHLKKKYGFQGRTWRWTFTVHPSNGGIIGLTLLDPAVLMCHSQFLHPTRLGLWWTYNPPISSCFFFPKPSLFHPFSMFFFHRFFPVFPWFSPSPRSFRPLMGPQRSPFWVPSRDSNKGPRTCDPTGWAWRGYRPQAQVHHLVGVTVVKCG